MAVVPQTTGEIPTRTLVLGMAHGDGTVQAAETYAVARACGLTDDQLRSCLRRLVSQGLFTRHGRGRSAHFEATPAGMRELKGTVERLQRAYRQDQEGRGWDRRWHLVGFGVPERQRSARDGLRDRLVTLGGAPIQHGLYVSPHPWEEAVAAEAEELGVAAQVTTAVTDDLVVGGTRDPRELARRLWNLDEVARRYQSFVESHREIPETLEGMRRRQERLTEADFLPAALRIGLAYNDCFASDPLLPPELLPRPWPGREARELLIRSRRLGVLIREERGQPVLFSLLDEVS